MSLYVILTIPYSRKIKDVFDERRRITRFRTGKCHPELVSGSVRGEGQEKARGEMLKQVQHDVWSHLLFILSFWGSQFNTSV